MAAFGSIFGFRTEGHLPELPNFHSHHDLWSVIAHGHYRSRDAKLTSIRNPAIRIAMKILGITFFGKSEAAAVSTQELELLHYAICDHTMVAYETDQEPDSHDANIGWMFAKIFASRKLDALKYPTRVEVMGSLVTPVLQYVGIPLGQFTPSSSHNSVDWPYLLSTKWFTKNQEFSFLHSGGRKCKVMLPQSEITSPTSLGNIRFLPGAANLQDEDAPVPDAPRLSRGQVQGRVSTQSRRSTQSRHPDPASEDDSPILPEDFSEFDLPPRRPDFTDSETIRWTADATERTHGMMQRMWKAIAKLRRPACFRAHRSDDEDEPSHRHGAGSSGQSSD